jgi:RNA 2',3'-cyclic 3'-phosphodiesterase
MSDRRIFLALDISDAARAACSAHIDSLRQDVRDVRVGWEREEKLHVTLKFLGDTTSNALEELQKRISDAASQHRRFQLCLSRPGVFPSKSRPRILWIGVDDPSGSIDPLHKDIDGICRHLGFESEAKRFHPHITIGRVRELQGASEFAAVHLRTPIESVQFDVTEIVIYESKLQPTGSVYTAISRVRLGV